MTIYITTLIWLALGWYIMYENRSYADYITSIFFKGLGLHILLASLAYIGLAAISVYTHHWAQDAVIPWLGWGSYPGYWISELIYSSEMFEQHMMELQMKRGY